MQKQYLEAGKFVTTHGVTGEIKIYPYCDGAEFLCGFDRLYPTLQGGRPWRVIGARAHKGMVLAQLEGVTTVEAARALVGRMCYIDRADAQLPAGHFFIEDLLGLDVLDADTGARYGSLRAVTNAGAGDLYEVETPDGRRVLVPAVPQFVAEIAPDRGAVRIRPIRGMFDDAD